MLSRAAAVSLSDVFFLLTDLQRLVLISAGNDLQCEKIYESLCLQFPDFRPSPPMSSFVFPGSNWNNNGKGNNRGTSSNSSTGSSTSSTVSSLKSSSSFSRSSSKGEGGPRRAFQTEHVEGDQSADAEFDAAVEAEGNGADLPPIAEEEDDGGEEEESAELTQEDLAELAQVLTVTSKKLHASTLGRRFSGRRSIEERKRTSTCSACGQLGHWSGDSICPISSGARKMARARGTNLVVRAPRPRKLAVLLGMAQRRPTWLDSMMSSMIFMTFLTMNPKVRLATLRSPLRIFLAQVFPRLG